MGRCGDPALEAVANPSSGGVKEKANGRWGEWETQPLKRLQTLQAGIRERAMWMYACNAVFLP